MAATPTLLKRLIESKVIKVEEYNNKSFDSGVQLFFDNGLILTAQDGEYGDNCFEFLSEAHPENPIPQTKNHYKPQITCLKHKH